jgi:signal transduction histidine kinase
VTAYLLISSFLNFAAAAVLAFAVVLRERKSELNFRFGLFALSVAAWSALYFLWQIAADAKSALLLCRLLLLPTFVFPVAYLHFVRQLCGEARGHWWLRAGYAGALLFAALDFSPLMVRSVMPVGGFEFWPQAGPAFAFYLLFFGLYLVWSLVLLHRHAQLSAGERAGQFRRIFFATLVGFVGGWTNYPLWYGVMIPPIGNGTVFLYLVAVGLVISRYQLPLATYDLVQAAAHIGIATTLAAAAVLLHTGTAALLDHVLTSGEMLNSFLLAMVVSLFFLWAVPQLKAGADRIIEQTYLRRRGRQRDRLQSLAQQICSIGAEDEIFETTAREVAVAMDVARLGLFVRGDFSDQLGLRAGTGWGAGGFTLDAFPADSALVRALARQNAPLIYDASELELPEDELAAIEALRATMPFEAAFPILTEGALLGVLVLGPRGGRGGYMDRDIALLEAICLQIAVTLRARQLERRANQAEKLISLGTLAAGLAHELRNPLVSIRTFAALMEEQGGDAEFRREFRAVVERDARRIGAIIEHVSAFAENTRVKFAPVRVDEVIAAVYDIARPEFTRAGVAFAAPPAGLPAVSGNYGQLLQVFLNLFQNAIHALAGRPAPRVEVRAQFAGGEGGVRMLVLAVSDNGAGIEPALLTHVFEPFVSTKATGDAARRGMGLGLALVKRIVEGHRGAITVTSEPGRGTTFFVHLPCLP